MGDGAMRDKDCVKFMQWALPRLQLRWAGYRRVHRQVCRRIARRMSELKYADIDAYRHYLDAHPEEWRLLDELCRVTISRFRRDQEAFEVLERDVIPALGEQVRARGEDILRVWSVGAASGEEPYTLGLAWHLSLKRRLAGLRFEVLATDPERGMLERAQAAVYPGNSLWELPQEWRDKAFVEEGENFRLRAEYRDGIRFQLHDVRLPAPPGPFDLILCRNLVCTYFSSELQREVLVALARVLQPGGALMLGMHEDLPTSVAHIFEPWDASLKIYRRVPDADLEGGAPDD